jgi:eukaryotic-like serine/threonine-protein kinase
VVPDPELASTISDDDPDSHEAPAAAPHRVLERGATIGRYIIVDQLGVGGMGVVYSAYDPELDRKLALKLLRDDTGRRDRRARLVREAQALARLDHPNVVAVYDVGAIDDQVFIAMELVAGRTVAAWLAEAPRGWRDIIAVYHQAGQGLAAAHALGIVHRDFKPENVLIDRVGRVRVVDFGLARPTATSGDAITISDDGEPSGDTPPAAFAVSLTRTGAVVGTPGYIAPELQRGDTRAAGDQFSFCVAVWKALYGELPFAGTSAKELARAALEGELRPVPRTSRVPARIQRALTRGLAADPAKRFSSLEALLAELTGTPRRARYAAVMLVLAGGVTAGVFALGSHSTNACRGPAFGLAGTWDPAKRDEITRAFAATGAGYAALEAASVTQILDQYATAWSAMRVDACEAHVRAEQSADLLDLRMECLGRRARELRAFADVLAHADVKVIDKSVQAALALTPIADCGDTAALRAPIRPPANPADRARIEELRGAVAEARALDSAGKFTDAVAKAKTLAAAARATHYRPLEAAALDALGLAQRDAGQFDVAQATLEQAVDAGIAAHDDATAGEAASWLVRVVGYDRAKQDDGEPWIRRAQAFLEARPDDRIRAQLENNIGNVRFAEDRFDEALDHHRNALALRQRLYGERSPLVAASYDNMGLSYDFKGDNATGTELHRKALAIDEAALGPTHPTVALTLTNLAVSMRMGGDLDGALETAKRALAIKEVVYGKDSAMVAVSLNEVGNNLFFRGDYPAAIEVFERSLAIKRKAYGPGHPMLASALGNIANCYMNMKDFAKAKPLVEEARDITTKSLGPEHSEVAHEYLRLGKILVAEGKIGEARAQIQHALKIWTAAFDPTNPLIANAEHDLGDLEEAAGNHAAAIAAYTRAMKIQDGGHGDVVDRAETHFALARALWASGNHLAAPPLARDSIELFRRGGARADNLRKEAESWSLAHP